MLLNSVDNLQDFALEFFSHLTKITTTITGPISQAIENSSRQMNAASRLSCLLDIATCEAQDAATWGPEVDLWRGREAQLRLKLRLSGSVAQLCQGPVGQCTTTIREQPHPQNQINFCYSYGVKSCKWHPLSFMLQWNNHYINKWFLAGKRSIFWDNFRVCGTRTHTG